MTPLKQVAPQPKPSPSHRIRVSFWMSEFESGSLLPRPTTSSSVSSLIAGPRLRLGLLDSQPAEFDDLVMKVQVPPVMKVDAGVTAASLVDLARDIVFRVTGGHQHAGEDDYGLRPALDATVEPLLDHRPRELQKAALDDPRRLMFAEKFHQPHELAGALGVSASVADDADG